MLTPCDSWHTPDAAAAAHLRVVPRGWQAGCLGNGQRASSRLPAFPSSACSAAGNFNEIPDQCLFSWGHHGNASKESAPLFLPPLPFATPIPNSEGSCTARRVPQTQTRVPHNFLQNESINEAFRGQLRVVNRIATERVYRGSNLPPVPPSLPLSLPPFLHCKCNLQLGLFSVFSLQSLVFSLWSSSRDRK